MKIGDIVERNRGPSGRGSYRDHIGYRDACEVIKAVPPMAVFSLRGFAGMIQGFLTARGLGSDDSYARAFFKAFWKAGWRYSYPLDTFYMPAYGEAVRGRDVAITPTRSLVNYLRGRVVMEDALESEVV